MLVIDELSGVCTEQHCHVMLVHGNGGIVFEVLLVREAPACPTEAGIVGEVDSTGLQ
jgi:hypothetical protein